MAGNNPNYQETATGYERKPDAPDAGHKSRIDWNRLNIVDNTRQGVQELRKRQDERNEQYRRDHANA